MSIILDWSASGRDKCNINDSDCAEWIFMQSENQENANKVDDMFIKSDEYVDNNDGALKGKVRKVEVDATDHRILFQGIPHRIKP